MSFGCILCASVGGIAPCMLEIINILLTVLTDDCANACVDVVEGPERAESVSDVIKWLVHVV